MNSFRAAGAILLVAAQCAWPQAPIRLKSGNLTPPPRDFQRLPVRSPRPGPQHYILQFGRYPGPEIRRELARRGVRVLEYVPDSALMVVSDSSVDLSGLDITWAGPLETRDKLSPRLSAGEASAYLVIFHRDVETRTARALVADRGFTVLENPGLLPGQLLIGGDAVRLSVLASSDEVSYILPASADLVAARTAIACPGALTEAGPIGEYATVGSGWAEDSSGAVNLRYVFESLTGKLDGAAARSEIERAFHEWTRYVTLGLTAGGNPEAARTFTIEFASGPHGDGYAFDGRGGVLAHTFYPSPPNPEPIAGDMHFDADESWRIGADTDLFTVALHEAGHALGLAHSDNPDSVMYPYYRFATGLSDDDIAGIRSLYPAAAATPPGTPPDPPQSPPSPPPQPPSNPNSGSDAAPPAIRIVSPAATIISTSLYSITISGTAADNVALAAVKWSTSTGYSGDASGLASWSAQVPLLVGTNVVTIRAYDAAGNSGWRAITVVRR